MSRITTVVDWRKTLRYFIKTSQRASKQSSMKRINRRYPYIHAGRKTSRTASIAISIDQSGSVSDSMLNAFFNELSKLAKYAQFTVVPFDDEVFAEKVYVWKKGESRKWERVLCGGTDFDAPTDYVNARSFDGHIVLTDLCAPKPKASKCQRIWMTTAHHAKHPYFQTNERIIAINE
jgi:predicted metal-dependent peptidase